MKVLFDYLPKVNKHRQYLPYFLFAHPDIYLNVDIYI